MKLKRWAARAAVPAAGAAVAGMMLVPQAASAAPGREQRVTGVHTSPLPLRAIKHVMVIELENESVARTFGAGSPATYLNGTLLPEGELVKNYYAIGHVSLGNYLAQVSGQAPNQLTSSDCVPSITSPTGVYQDVTPGVLDPDQAKYPGQVDGQGCVFPASVPTIGNQLDQAYPRDITHDWREYAADMGNDPARDGGQADSLGGTDCAHPAQVNGTAADATENAEGPNAAGSQVRSATTDQYTNRHDPFIYFHSVTDNQRLCDQDVVPLGIATKQANGTIAYQGHLADDLRSERTTPKFAFVSPNLCGDGHDASCAGTNDAGGTTGGLVGADDFLKTWMPLILSSPAYCSGSLLVMITFDEGAATDSATGDSEQPGPNNVNPGYAPSLNQPIPAAGGLTLYDLIGVTGLTPNQEPPAGTMPGGGQTGAVLFNRRWIKAGSVDTAGSYNHYSALRTFEDLLGIDSGGADGRGHLGFAATAHDFGPDVFNRG
jgi:hypothetical protein